MSGCCGMTSPSGPGHSQRTWPNFSRESYTAKRVPVLTFRLKGSPGSIITHQHQTPVCSFDNKTLRFLGGYGDTGFFRVTALPNKDGHRGDRSAVAHDGNCFASNLGQIMLQLIRPGFSCGGTVCSDDDGFYFLTAALDRYSARRRIGPNKTHSNDQAKNDHEVVYQWR